MIDGSGLARAPERPADCSGDRPVSPQPAPTRSQGRSVVLLVLGVLLVAANLRPALTSVGPVLPELRADLGLSAAAAGALTALPLLAFAAGGLGTPALGRLLGTERTLVAALVIIAAGTAVRSAAQGTGLFAGTVVLALGIGAANVLLPSVVKATLPTRVPLVTSWYAAVLNLAASLASGVAEPIARASAGGWRTAMGCWGILAVVTAAAWLPAALRARSTTARRGAAVGPISGSPWRSRVAWAVAGYFALQSAVFYSVVAWLPTVMIARGTDPTVAGLLLLTYQLVGLLGGLAVPLLLRGRTDQRGAAMLASGTSAIGLLGLALLPGSEWLWVVVAGTASGALFTLALTLITERSVDAARSASLSSMAQSAGYLISAAGPLLVGALHEVTGTWTVPMVLLGAVSATGVVVARPAGADRLVT